MVSYKCSILAIAFGILADCLVFPALNDLEADSRLNSKTNSKVFLFDFDVRLGRARRNNVDKRGTPGEGLTNQNEIYYSIELLVGSNQQEVYVDIDTGSSDLWVVSNRVSCLEDYESDCTDGGTFDTDLSITWNATDEPFSINYADQSGAEGFYGYDSIQIPNGPTLNNFKFAVANSESAGGGVFGIGKQADEAEGSYPNFPEALKIEGIIDKVGYSIWLNLPSASSGSIVFGGYDLAKYYGSLVTLPVRSTTELRVTVNSATLGNGTIVEINQDAVLDTGTTITYIPKASFEAVSALFGGNQTYDRSTGLLNVSCDHGSDQLTYNFNGISIQVPYSSLLSPATDQYGWPTSGCFLNILASDNVVFGDNFLRYAYSVFDIEENTISIAQSKFTSESNIVPF